jgi:hypothetical protein
MLRRNKRDRYFSREEWGARPPEPGPGYLTVNRVRGIALHWPAMSGRLTTTRAVKSALRNWQAYHMDTHGWSDIAYQIAIDQRGNRYKLRGLWRQSAANGDTDVNEEFGAILLVVGPGEPLTDALINATRRAVADHRDRFPNSRLIVPHSQIRPGGTSCPGDMVRAHIARDTFEPKNRRK